MYIVSIKVTSPAHRTFGNRMKLKQLAAKALEILHVGIQIANNQLARYRENQVTQILILCNHLSLICYQKN
jgi:hypothetical protein